MSAIVALKTPLSYLTLCFKALGIFLLLLVALWNVAKLPYFLTDEENFPATSITYNETRCLNSTEYWCHGTEGSITMSEKLVEGYRGGKLSTHPLMFLALHVIVGATVLITAALSVVFPPLRRKYGHFFFISCFILGLHTMPATLLVDPPIKTVVFWFTTYVEVTFSVVGALTLLLYDRMKPHSERLLLACWSLNSIGAMGAGAAEFFSIITRSIFKSRHGYYEYDSNVPSPLSGINIYDSCSSEFIWFMSIMWIVAIWILCVVVELLRWKGILHENFWTCCFYNKLRQSYHIYLEVEEDDVTPTPFADRDIEMDQIGTAKRSAPNSPSETGGVEEKFEKEVVRPDSPGLIEAYQVFEITQDGDIILKVSSESVRLFTYMMFWIMIVFASIITAITASPDTLANSTAIKVFGYNNVCINWDTTPARQLTAMIHPVLEASMVLYIGLLWLRKRRAHQKHLISSFQMTMNNYTTIVLIVLTLWSRLMFVIEIDTNLVGHTLAFYSLQMVFTVIILSNFALSLSLRLLPCPLWLGLIHIGLLIGTAIIKTFLMVSVLAGHPAYLFEQIPVSKGIVHFVDIAWLILHSIIPIALSYRARNFTPPSVFVFPNPSALWLPPTDEALPTKENPEQQSSDNVSTKHDVEMTDIPKVEKQEEATPGLDEKSDTKIETLKTGIFALLTPKEEAFISDAEFKKQNTVGNQKARERVLIMFQSDTDGIWIELNSETVRLIVYMMFWSMVAFAVIITSLSTTDEDIEDSALVQTFGFNNICIYWDYSPSRELTAMFYTLVEFPLIAYLCLNFIRKYHGFLANSISLLHIQLEMFMTPFLFVMVFWFRMIFVVGAFESVAGHTLGFFGLQISLLLVLFSNYGYHASHKTLASNRNLSIAYLVSAVAITVCKISLASSVFAGNAIYAVGTTSGNRFAHAIDIFWMILQSVLPAVFSWRNRQRTPASVIHVR